MTEITKTLGRDERMIAALKAALIIEQQTEIMNEHIPQIADDYGVNKATARKIIKAYAKDSLEKTQEKLEDERSSLANAEVMIEAVEEITVDTEAILAETAPVEETETTEETA